LLDSDYLSLAEVQVMERLVHIQYGLCSYLRNSHQCYHPLHSSDYLSLAEVQVMGVDPLRFAEVEKVLLISVGAEVCFIRNTNFWWG
jgi:hypothetical protein